MWRNYLMWGGILAALGVLVGTGWWLYDMGKLRGVAELGTLRTEYAVLKRLHEKTYKENRKLREKVAILERSSQIDRQAAEDVKADLGQLEEELQASREEIEFYRGIISPGDVKSGLRIHRFSLQNGVAAGEYRYELVLTQLKHNDRYVSGVVEWKITGMIEGEPGEFSLVDVTSPAVKQLKFRFRYFQDLAGTLTLPKGFVAEQVELRIRPEGKGKGKPDPVAQTFDWPVAGS
jgi:hypothetical protein